MSPDPNKKIPRQFQCRESLWQKFEQMARELECSVDYLINDAMKQYARQRGYAGGAASQRSDAMSSASNSIGPSAPYAAAESPSSTTPGSGAYGTPTGVASAAARHGSGAHPMPGGLHGAVPGSDGVGSGAHGILTAPPAPRYGAAPPMPAAQAAPAGHAGPIVAPPPGSARTVPLAVPPAPPAPGAKRVGPPPLPTTSTGLPNVSRVPAPPPLPASQARTLSSAQMHAPAHVPAAAAARRLQIRYQGQSFPVTKDKFIIGRGKQTSDLTIKDPNVSRQHAMIEFDGKEYCIVDLGSTNGIEYQGQRVQRKILADGDVVRICDHELSFQYR
jgi:neural Wiskott-Aldrich syndrome protein